MAIKVVEGPVIRAGESLSEPLDCTAGKLIRVMMPDNWNAGQGQSKPSLTFVISNDGVNWYDLCDRDGFIWEIQTVVPNTTVMVQENQIQQAYVKFRSGSVAYPVVQEADRHFKVALEVASTGPDRPLGKTQQAAPQQVTMFLPTYGWIPGYGFVCIYPQR